MIDNVRLRILLVALAGWVNRHQLEVIAYLREENRVLKEHLGGRGLRLTDAQRRRLAATGHRLGRRDPGPDRKRIAEPNGDNNETVVVIGFDEPQPPR